jgi:hypothetical protein
MVKDLSVAQLSSPATHDDIGRSATSHGHEMHPISPCPRPNPSPARSFTPPPTPRGYPLCDEHESRLRRGSRRGVHRRHDTLHLKIFSCTVPWPSSSVVLIEHVWGDLPQNLHSTRPSVIQQFCLPMLGLQLCHSDSDLISIELTMNCFQS